MKIAKDRGHDVLFTPPYRSNLQPIELVWANSKGEVGRQDDTNTTFQDVEQRLQRSFDNIKSKTIHGCIRTAESELMKLYEYLLQLDAIEEMDCSDESDNDYFDVDNAFDSEDSSIENDLFSL